MLVAFVLTSCEHKELCFKHPHTVRLRVAFDWTKAPEATPAGMVVLFYPVEGGPCKRVDFQGKKGGEIELALGRYRIIYHNNDSEVNQYANMNDFDRYKVFTRKGHIFEPIYGNATGNTPAGPLKGEESVHISPDKLFAGNVQMIEITENGVEHMAGERCDYKKGQVGGGYIINEWTIALCPVKRTATYTYEIQRVNNLRSVEQMSGSLSGMCMGGYLGLLALEHNGTVVVPFEAHSDGVRVITGQFCAFPYCHEHTPKVIFCLYVWLKNGAKYYYSYDVTKQVDDALDPYNVHIIIDGLDLPHDIEDDNSFDVSVDGWDEVEEEIIL